MARNPLIDLLQHLRRRVLRGEGEGKTDGQLLEAFVRGRDGAALEALVQRHAPMVWGVCRRTLANHHDAEDAFQAAFLVLVRKAASIRSRELLANWLYRVAHQTARKARQMAAKRCARERQVTVMPEPPQVESPDQQFGPELRQLLDEELSRLPDKYRIAILLCDLEERSRAEAAQQLRVPEGTVGSRLARGRALLARRLARRGLNVSPASLAAGLVHQAASASEPAALLANTIKAAALVAGGGAAAAGAMSANVHALSQEVMKALAVTKLKAAAVVLLAAGLVLAGGLVTPRVLAAINASAPDRDGPAMGKGEGPAPGFGNFGTEEDAKAFVTERFRHGLFDPTGQIMRAFEEFLAAKLDPKTGRWTVTYIMPHAQSPFEQIDHRTETTVVVSYTQSDHSWHKLSEERRDLEPDGKPGKP